MNRRKYPFSMFCMGIILNFIKLWPFFIAITILGIVHLVFHVVPLVIPIILAGIWILGAVIWQYKNRKILLSHSDNEETNELLDKMLADNSRGYKNITGTVNEIIKEHENDQINS